MGDKYIKIASKERARQRNIARHHLANGPSIGNLYRAAEAFYKSLPFVTTAATVNPYMITGDVPTDATPASAITKANAAFKTAKEWDEAYNKAVKIGNMKEAKRLRGLHFETKAGNYITENGRLKTLYRGDKKFHKNLKARDEGYGYWATTDKDYALNFTKHSTVKENHGYIDRYYHQGNEDKVRKFYAKSNKPVEYDKVLSNGEVKYIRRNVKKLEDYERNWGDIKENVSKRYDLQYERNKYLREIGTDNIKYKTSSRKEQSALQRKYPKLREIEDELYVYDAAVEAYPGDEKNLSKFINSDAIYGHDFKQSDYGWTNSKGVEYSFKSPNQLKLKDTITYDDTGNIIPLSKRDNFDVNDIRYGFAPWLIGAGAATAVGYEGRRRLESKGKKSK